MTKNGIIPLELECEDISFADLDAEEKVKSNDSLISVLYIIEEDDLLSLAYQIQHLVSDVQRDEDRHEKSQWPLITIDL